MDPYPKVYEKPNAILMSDLAVYAVHPIPDIRILKRLRDEVLLPPDCT